MESCTLPDTWQFGVSGKSILYMGPQPSQTGINCEEALKEREWFTTEVVGRRGRLTQATFLPASLHDSYLEFCPLASPKITHFCFSISASVKSEATDPMVPGKQRQGESPGSLTIQPSQFDKF